MSLHTDYTLHLKKSISSSRSSDKLLITNKSHTNRHKHDMIVMMIVSFFHFAD